MIVFGLPLKLAVELAAVVLLVVLNIRGVKESVTVLLPIFLLFVLTHAIIVAVGIVGWMVYRSRRRRTLVERLQSAIPDSVRDLPQEMRAQVKRAL